jgi:hypothetical protein
MPGAVAPASLGLRVEGPRRGEGSSPATALSSRRASWADALLQAFLVEKSRMARPPGVALLGAMSPSPEVAAPPGRRTHPRPLAGSPVQMPTTHIPALPRPLLMLPLLLAAACGSGSGSPGDVQTPPDGGTTVDAGPTFLRTEGWSAHRRMRLASGTDVVLEQQLASFTVADPGASRIRRIDSASSTPWSAPAGLFIEDAALHPSGAVTAVLIDASFGVWLARLSPDLVLLDLQQLHDPDIVHDPFPDGGLGVSPPTEVIANFLPRDSVRTAPDGEEAVVVVDTTLESVLLYRLAFSTHWEAPRRTLVMPVSHHIPFLPIGGSFDTFGAMWSSFRALVDVDGDGNAYVAFWADPRKIEAHSAFAGDDLHKISTEPFSRDSDVLLEKLDRSGSMLWARVVGTENEDEPYALRAAHGEVAVVGRSRRVPGDDNTFWDAFLSVSAADGTLRGTTAFQLEASSIFLAVDGIPDGGWLAGGSEGWSQNPSGLSVLTFGSKLLTEISAPDAGPVRLPLPAGPRHNEIRSVLADSSHRWFGGHEDGPVMHTGDGDLSQIHATGVVGFVGR